MDHALRTISYIADIGDLVVLMARRRYVPHEVDDPPKINRTPKMICHVFESEEVSWTRLAQFVLKICLKTYWGLRRLAGTLHQMIRTLLLHFNKRKKSNHRVDLRMFVPLFMSLSFFYNKQSVNIFNYWRV